MHASTRFSWDCLYRRTLIYTPRQAATWLNDPDVREALHAEPMEKIGRFTVGPALCRHARRRTARQEGWGGVRRGAEDCAAGGVRHSAGMRRTARQAKDCAAGGVG